MSDSKSSTTPAKRPSKPIPTTAQPSSTPSSSQPAEQKSATAATSASVPTAAASAGAAEYPSTHIGSYLSWGYNFEEESKKNPGYICGGQDIHTPRSPTRGEERRQE